MNLDKFTERSRGFIQSAQTIAQRDDHARLGPEHLLKALLEDSRPFLRPPLAHCYVGRAASRRRQRRRPARPPRPGLWA